MGATVRLTTAQALVRWMAAQRSELLDGTPVPLFAGVFAIFGHGNVLGLGSALQETAGALPVWRGQNEQGMALAAIAYAKASERRQVMAATSSIGPGALNMVTAAGLAHADRLPVLLLPGDTFASRAPDPVLQQIEPYGSGEVSVNDAFRPVARYFDRITRPEQLLACLPQAARVLTDPADCGPVVLALPQDVQAETFDFPAGLFEPRLARVPRPRPDAREVTAAAALLRSARRPLIVAGGGVRYSGAGGALLSFAEARGIPAADTAAARTVLPGPHPLYAGPVGTIGSASANALAADADVVLAVGTRLQDFTTASWSVFGAGMRLISVNAARFDAVKHGGLAVTGDAMAAVGELAGAAELASWQAPPEWAARAAAGKARWDAHIDGLRAGAGGSGELTYAQVVGVVNDLSGPQDYVLGSSGGIPGELNGGWRAGPGGAATMDLEYGFSCMGYELAGPWGAAMARSATHPGGLVTALLGDGSYLMANSELYSAAFAGVPFVAVVCDNGGYAVIQRLQTGQGAAGFNNMWPQVAGPGAAPAGARVSFAAHAAALGCGAIGVPAGAGAAGLREAYARARSQARAQSRPVVVVCRVCASAWTESGAWWEVGVPAALPGHAQSAPRKAAQLRWTAG